MMRSRSIRPVAALVLLIGMRTAAAADVVGKWFSQTGDEVITIYKAGPEYAASIPATQGTNSVGTYMIILNDFGVVGTHVHFRIESDQTTGRPFTVGSVYDLDLSPEGQRLTGTQQTYGGFTPLNGTKPVTLFLRN
jgi:hypothetical protein